MPDILPPGDMPAPNATEVGPGWASFWQDEFWQALWPKLIPNYANAAARDAELAGLAPTDVAFAYLTDIKRLTFWTGVDWMHVGGRRTNGGVTINALAVGASQSIAVTFPAGLFTSTPRVQVSTGGTKLGAAYGSITTAGFTFSVANNGAGASGATVGSWSAEQL